MSIPCRASRLSASPLSYTPVLIWHAGSCYRWVWPVWSSINGTFLNPTNVKSIQPVERTAFLVPKLIQKILCCSWMFHNTYKSRTNFPTPKIMLSKMWVKYSNHAILVCFYKSLCSFNNYGTMFRFQLVPKKCCTRWAKEQLY